MNNHSQCRIAEDVVILPGAHITGHVTIAPGCSVWYNTVIRGDEAPITIDENTNIQDNCTLHTDHDTPLHIGRGVTVGHNAILHGCTVGDNSLIGMGSIVLDGAVVGQDCIVGAGALVTMRTAIPDGSIVLGSPAKVKRALTPEEIEHLRSSAERYLVLKEQYR